MFHKLVPNNSTVQRSEKTSVAAPASPAARKKGQQYRWPAYIQFCRTYFVQVSLIIFTSVTLKLPIASLLDAFSTCPSFFSSAFVSGLAVPVTVT